MNGIYLRAVLLGGLLVLGCDRAPQPPPAVSAPSTPSAQTPPTTQELVAGAYKTIALPGMPLSVKAPQSWKLDIAGTVIFLVGPTPSGLVATIKVSSSDILFKPEQIDTLVKDAKAQQEKQPGRFVKVDFQEVGRVKLLERISFDAPRTSPKLDAHGVGILDNNGKEVMETFTPVRWILTVFVPSDAGFTRYELNFMDLNKDQYDVDRTLLEKVIRNVTFEPSLVPTTAPS